MFTFLKNTSNFQLTSIYQLSAVCLCHCQPQLSARNMLEKSCQLLPFMSTTDWKRICQRQNVIPSSFLFLDFVYILVIYFLLLFILNAIFCNSYFVSLLRFIIFFVFLLFYRFLKIDHLSAYPAYTNEHAIVYVHETYYQKSF